MSRCTAAILKSMGDDPVEWFTSEIIRSLCLTRGAVHDGKPSVWDVAVSRPRICVLSVFNLWLKNIVILVAAPPHCVFRGSLFAGTDH
jgi:hypothetical protein